ncbi:Anthranilate phosphoribosyltransferase [Candidatus Portiera aleyrodidarum]|uniref:Anthranilate phosphoribosyltransferase n=1 Tax=Candidatus Portiera aleyrodidarum TaxID=91844 RepID=A0A6S6S643_9GAMM|nr:anthranilate phosphoribosyltransferase [Candidatus Portiera aleyrodidarum]CAA3707593.1 Anthranilate phosphoribosyltransferase [Candidatus Portiera aleyrodidarum]
MIYTILKHLINKQNIKFNNCYKIIKAIIFGKIKSTQISSILTALAIKKETSEEIAATAKVINDYYNYNMTNDNVMDLVGTGSDSVNYFNISTTASLVVAAAGSINVAKYGSKSISSHSGSLDLLNALGVNLKLKKKDIIKCITKLRLVFLKSEFKYKKKIRKLRMDLKIPTIFNIIGPLTNPIHPLKQLVGVYDKRLLNVLSKVFMKLGSNTTLIIHSKEGSDEISLKNSTYISELNNGKIKNYLINPNNFGIKNKTLDLIKIKNVLQSLDIIINSIQGNLGIAFEIIILNSGTALYVSGVVNNIKNGIELAKYILISGKAYEKLKTIVYFTKCLNKGIF